MRRSRRLHGYEFFIRAKTKTHDHQRDTTHSTRTSHVLEDSPRRTHRRLTQTNPRTPHAHAVSTHALYRRTPRTSTMSRWSQSRPNRTTLASHQVACHHGHSHPPTFSSARAPTPARCSASAHALSSRARCANAPSHTHVRHSLRASSLEGLRGALHRLGQRADPSRHRGVRISCHRRRRRELPKRGC